MPPTLRLPWESDAGGESLSSRLLKIATATEAEDFRAEASHWNELVNGRPVWFWLHLHTTERPLVARARAEGFELDGEEILSAVAELSGELGYQPEVKSEGHLVRYEWRADEVWLAFERSPELALHDGVTQVRLASPDCWRQLPLCPHMEGDEEEPAPQRQVVSYRADGLTDQEVKVLPCHNRHPEIPDGEVEPHTLEECGQQDELLQALGGLDNIPAGLGGRAGEVTKPHRAADSEDAKARQERAKLLGQGLVAGVAKRILEEARDLPLDQLRAIVEEARGAAEAMEGNGGEGWAMGEARTGEECVRCGERLRGGEAIYRGLNGDDRVFHPRCLLYRAAELSRANRSPPPNKGAEDLSEPGKPGTDHGEILEPRGEEAQLVFICQESGTRRTHDPRFPVEACCLCADSKRPCRIRLTRAKGEGVDLVLDPGTAWNWGDWDALDTLANAVHWTGDVPPFHFPQEKLAKAEAKATGATGATGATDDGEEDHPGYAAVLLRQGSWFERRQPGQDVFACCECGKWIGAGKPLFRKGPHAAHASCVLAVARKAWRNGTLEMVLGGNELPPLPPEGNPGDYCEWHPAKDESEDRPAQGGDPFHAFSEVLVGSKDTWRVCRNCLKRRRFARFRKVTEIK